MIVAKKHIQNSNYSQRERNFLKTITSGDTFQVIIGRNNKDSILLWQDEYYMKEYLNNCKDSIKLSKVDTIAFLKWLKNLPEEKYFLIHPVFDQEIPKFNQNELLVKIIDKIESDGDFYDSLRENELL